MATFVTNKALELYVSGDLDPGAKTYKIALFKTDPTATKDMNFISELTPGTNECDFTNYVRKTVTVSVAENDTDDRAYVTISGTVTWTAAGGATNNTIVAAVLLVDEGGADSANPFVAWFDHSDQPTNGGDIVLSFASSRLMTLQSA